MDHLLKYYSQLAKENGLNFSSREILKHRVIGLDGVQRKILVVQKEDGFFGSFIIDLKRVKTCAVKKIYGPINAGELKHRKPEQDLEKISLHFDLDNNSSVEIVFYKKFENHSREAFELEGKAKSWSAILSQLQSPV